eukprot:TRINITY_DN481_c0_g1_i1.p1 TRINITY_DN481_c0_g1~~TRINITY_DN481_c0_g1_i1.p1  ORF type:complete len:388 (-),score=75.94 TRINITY_DN481_c0_g1_i1:23-1186(-)
MNKDDTMGNGLFGNCMPQPREIDSSDLEDADHKGLRVDKEFALERKAAVAAVAKACMVCQRAQATLVSQESIEKKDQSPVTIADFAAQALIITELTKAFDYPFIAEEDSADLQENAEMRARVLELVKMVLPYMEEEPLLEAINKGDTTKVSPETKLWWTLDPVDGTMGFLRNGQYAVALALMKDNEPVLGVLGCPSLPRKSLGPEADSKDSDKARELLGEDQVGVILVAVRGQGAYIRGVDAADAEETRIEVSDVSEASRGVFTESFVSSHSSHDAGADIAKKLNMTAPSVRIDSQCKYAIVARGDVSAYVRVSGGTYQEKIWDHAGGVVIVQEAGGRVTDLLGNPLDFSQGRTLSRNRGIVASNGQVHSAILAAIKEVDPLGLNKL